MMDGVPLDDGDVGRMSRSWSAGDKPVEQLRVLGRALEQLMPDHQSLGMFLIREDILIAGPGRLDLEVAETVDADSGLVEILETGQEAEDRGFVAQSPEDKPAAPRDLFDLVLRGRPDLRPGQVVAFNRPPDTDQQGRALDFNIDVTEVTKTQEIAIYVRGVTHRLTRELGFVTTLRGVSVPGFSKTAAIPTWHGSNDAAPLRPNPTEAPPATGARRPKWFATSTSEHCRARGVAPTSGRSAAPNVDAGASTRPDERVRRGAFAGDGRRYGAARFEVDAKRHTIFDEAPYDDSVRLRQVRAGAAALPGDAGASRPSRRRQRRSGRRRRAVDAGTAPASQPGD